MIIYEQVIVEKRQYRSPEGEGKHSGEPAAGIIPIFILSQLQHDEYGKTIIRNHSGREGGI